jgi:acetylornithine deacetylase/succinyl-diaminopimelate desuccinylase-like protein
MVDYNELMAFLSVPRPNGSAAERETARSLQDWLDRNNIPHQLHSFRIYPYFFECIGIWLILSRTLLALAVWGRWGWLTLPIAVVGLLGGTLDVALNWPLVTWPGARTGGNLIIEFEAPQPRREIILSAHYDSKTELLDHRQRMFLLKRMNLGIYLTLLLGLWGPVDRWLAQTHWESPIFWFGAALTIPMLLLAWGLGTHLSLGRFLEPSQGAVDNGAACAILLGLARRILEDQVSLDDKKITLALFTGEEVNMQGSRAYVRSRDWLLPAAALNLEVMAQDGEYVYWEEEGNVFRLVPTSSTLNSTLAAAVEQVTGRAAQPVGPVNSDGASFLFGGIPATTMGTFDTRLAKTGFHRPRDNLARVVMDRLPEGVDILEAFLKLHT